MSGAGRVVPKAVSFGLAIFSVLYLGFIFVGNFVESMSLTWGFSLQVTLLVVSGYMAGFFAKHHGWLNGLFVGIAAPVILAIGTAITTFDIAIAAQVFSALGAVWLIQSVVCCALGGFVWDVQSKLSRADP